MRNLDTVSQFVPIERNIVTFQKKDQITAFSILFLALFYPLLAFPVSLYAIYHNKKQWKVCIFAMSMFFAAMAHCYTPEWKNDLVRYWSIAENLSRLSFTDAFSTVYGNSELRLYIFNFIAWISGKADLHLMPAISTFVVYYTAFYITCKIGLSSGNNWKYTFEYLVFIMCFLNFYEVTETVRNIMAFAIVEAAVFRDIYEGKKDLKTLALYIIPVFIHPTAILLVAIRIGLNLISIMKTLLLLSIALLSFIVNWLYNSFFNVINIPVIKAVISKAYFYLLNNTNEWGATIQRSSYYNLRRIVYVGFAVIICVYYFSNIYAERKHLLESTKSLSIEKLQSYAFIILLMTIACSNTLTHEYWRFVSPLVILGAVYYIPYANGVIYKRFSVLIVLLKYILCVLGLILGTYHLTLSNFQGIKTIFSSMISTCPIFIILENLLAFIGII